MNLTPELEKLKDEIEGYVRSYGLDSFEIIFQILDFDKLNEVASYGGFPTRYPHWRHGMEYEQLQKAYAYGLQKIYELVVNTDPTYAYLLECNEIVDQKLVMAHVYGHSDFFKNNQWFSKTYRKMMDEIANHGVRIRQFIERYGEDNVEGFIDCCLSLEHLIDYHSPFIQRTEETYEYDFEDENCLCEKKGIKKIKSKDYMDDFINPKEFIQEQKDRFKEEAKKKKKFPENPEKDILLFLIEHAPVENWKKEILSIIREESYYFAPQAQTKIMNEGWASYWHSKILTQKCLKDSELIDYADHHSGTMGVRPGGINPYKIGVELFRDIEERWNKGKFGKEYEECDNLAEKKNWDKKLGLGIEKIFEVRKIYNDIGFIDTFLTEEFCDSHKLFTYQFNERNKNYEISSRHFKEIKSKLLFSLTNMGQPLIYAEDGNYENKGELYLKHRHNGIDMKIDYAKDTVSNVQKIWRRPVHLETVLNGKETLFSFNGSEHREREIGLKTFHPFHGLPNAGGIF
ncbi:MAG: SpoVR family protein [Thermodesulfobacteriota bacterium]|nr:SpoVR family protein [Thermodesulfobacteriota bacterium]